MRKRNVFTKPVTSGRAMGIVMINNTTVCVPLEVAEEIQKLRNAVRRARVALESLPETEPDKSTAIF